VAVLITGGSGFVGLNVAEALLSRGGTVVTLSNGALPNAARDDFIALPGTLVTVQGDVRDGDLVRRAIIEHGVDRVFHGAAITADRQRELRSTKEVVDVNVMGTVAVLEAAHQQGVRRVVYASSGAVYGDARFALEPLDETAAPSPGTLYGITKLAGEMLVRRYRELRGLPAVSARMNAAFGPWERDTGVRDTLSPILELAVLAVRGERARVRRGSPQDWIYSRDVAEACVALLSTDDLPYEVYNVAPGASWDLADWIDILSVAYPGFEVERDANEDHANVFEHTDPKRRKTPVCNDRIRELVPEFPSHDRARALEDFLAWILGHADFVAGSSTT
jgi:nucleoside-diphosphate-sugar epimerase